MILAKIVHDGKEYIFEKIRVDKERILCVSVKNINKYYFQFDWENVIGVGTIEVMATNDGINFSVMKYGDDVDMILNIDTADGASYFADYIGHNAKYLCFKITGFTDGYFKGTINFV
jgi:hypothetical protein